MKKITTSLHGKIKKGRKQATADRGTRALAGSISSFCRVLAVSAITAMGLGNAKAVTYFWDPAGTKSSLGGGFGTWDSGTTQAWWPSTGTPGVTLDVAWDNTGTTDAIFGNAGSDVGVGDAVQVGSITIRSAGYRFNNGATNDGVIQFTTGGTNTITVTNPGQSARINTFLSGTTSATRLTKAGGGTLILDGDSSGSKTIVGGTTPGTYLGIQGGITISGGTLVLDYTQNSPVRILDTANTLTFSNSSEFQFKADSGLGPSAASMALNRLTFSGGEGIVHSAAGNLEESKLTFADLAARATGATGNFVQDGLPQTAAPVSSSGSTITVSAADASALNGLSGTVSVTGTNIPAGTTVTSIDTTTNIVTLSAAPTGPVAGQSLTFGLSNRRIILTNINNAAATTGFINQGFFFNGDSFAWYDTANFARVRGINYGLDANTATQAATNTGIILGSANKHVLITGDVAGQGTLTVLTLNIRGSSFVSGLIQNPGTTLTLTNGGLLKSGGSSATISGGTIQAGPAGASELVIRTDITSDKLFINSVITANGVTKSGLGSLLLNPQTSGALSFSGAATTSGSNILQLAPSNAANPAVLTPGLAVNGPGIPANTTIASISGSTVTLSQPANATSVLPLSYSTTLDTTTANITLSPAEAGTLAVGQIVSGAGIAPNTVIAPGGINTTTGVITLSTPPTTSAPLQTVTFGGATVAIGSTQNFNVVSGPLNNDHTTTTINSPTVTLTMGIPSLLAGMSVEGPGIAAGTTISSVAGQTVTLSQVATASSSTASGAVNTYTAQVGNGSNSTTLPAGQANQLVVGALVTGVNVLPNTTVASVTPAGGGNSTVTFSKATPALQQLFPSATVPSGSTTVTLPAGQASNLVVNTSVTGAGIASGTTVLSIDVANNTVTLSNPTTAAIPTTSQINFAATTNQSLTFGGATLAFGARTLTLTPAQAASVVVGSTVTGTGIPANTTVVSIQDLGSYKIATLSKATTGTPTLEFVSFGGATVVNINSAYAGNTLVNAGIFAVSSSGLPTAGGVTVAALAEFSAVNSIIPNAITISGVNATLSAAAGNNAGFSGPINAGANDFQLKAPDGFSNLAVSSAITGSGILIVPSTSGGIVTLTGNNSAFTGGVRIENSATLSIARLISLPNGNPIDLSGTLKLALDGGAGAPYALGGNGTGAPQVLTFTSNVDATNGGTIQPDRDGTAYGGYFTRAANKTIRLGALTLGPNALNIQNNAGSGIEFTGVVTMSNGAVGLFNVINQTASNVVQGLTLSNKLTGGGVLAGVDTFLKTGSGTVVLGSSSNDFGGNGSVIHIRGGVVAVGSNAALGDLANTISLDWDAANVAVPATLRAIGSVPFGTARAIGLNSASSNIIEVVGGQTFTVSSPFVLPVAPGDANPLTKAENGILILAANNNPGASPWKGTVQINAGAIRIQSGNALGNQNVSTSARVTVARSGAALQLNGGAAGASVNNPLTLNGSGLSSAGAVQSLSGTGANFLNNQIILGSAATLGADAGSTLNVAGGVTGVNGVNLTFNSTGTISVITSQLDPAYGFTGDLGSTTTVTNVSNINSLVVGMALTGSNLQAGTTITGINIPLDQITLSKAATASVSGNPLAAQGLLNIVKNGTGTANLNVDSPTFGGSITVNQGTFSIGGNGVTIGKAAGSNILLVQQPSGTLVVDDSAGAPQQRIATGPTYTATVGNGASNITLTPAQAATLAVGQTVTGIGIAPNTTISAIQSNGSGGFTVSLSGPTTGTSGTQSLTFASRNLVLAGGNFTYNGNASGSAQVLGWLTSLRGTTNVITSNPNGGNVVLTFGGLASNTNGPTNATPPTNSLAGDTSLDFRGTNLGTPSNTILFVTAPALTNNILQRATIFGNEFVSYNTNGVTGNLNGIQAFANYNTSNNINGALVTDTLSFTADPASNFNAPKVINAFKIGGGVTVGDSGLQGNSLTLSAGAILSPTGSNTVNFKTVSFGAQGFVAVSTGSQLTVNSLLTGGSGFVKALPGTLFLNAPDDRAGYANLSGQTLTGNFEVNAGLLKLGGGNNTLTPNQFLIVAPGATLDLNGTFQFATGTRGDGGALQGNAGTFTNSSTTSASALIFGADSGAVNFGGVIKQEAGAGAMSFLKASGQTYTFLNANTYTGATVFAGGTNVLQDGGTLSNTSSIALNYARLAFNGDANFALANRVNAAAPITMNGGSLTYGNGRSQAELVQTVGAVSLMEGQNFFLSLLPNVPGVTSATLTLASLSRPAGSSATVRFADLNPANTGVLNFGALGTIGSTGRVVITSAPVLTQNLIGPWAVVDREFASSIPVLGVGALNSTGFAGYSPNFLNRQPLATDNIRATLNVPGLTVDTTVNTLAVNTNVAAVNSVPVPTLIDLGGKKLTLAGGGLILALNGDNQNITVQNGTITSTGPGVGTGSDLYVHALNYGGNNRTFTISAGIVNNSTGAVRLVKSSGSGDTALGSVNADFLMLTGVNTYSGGTVVNGGNLVVGAGGNIPAGDITIGGGEVVGVGAIFQDVGGVINSANKVTVNGLGALTLAGSNTLAGLVFRNSGGGGTAPTVTTFRSLSPIGTGTLTLGGGGILSTPLNPAAVATVAGRLDFGVLASTVTVNTYDFGTAVDFAPTTAGLVLQGVIGSGGGITKNGGGVLQLNAQEVFTGTLNVAAGTLQLGTGNAGSRFSQLNLSTPTSRLNLNNQSTTFGSLAGSGIITSTAGTPNFAVGFDNTNTTFSGQISRFNDATPSSLTLIKIGTGTLTMTSAQSGISGSSGGVTVNGGGLTYSGAGASYPSTQITPVTFNVNTSGTLTLDNTGTNVANRLGLNAAQGTVNLSGGTLAMIANAAGSTETVNVLNFNNGASTIQLTPGAAGPTTITVTGSVSGQGGQDSGLLTGNGLGGSVLAAGTVNVVVTGTFTTTGGGGGPGTETISIRPDLLGDAAGGAGTGFVTRDTGTNVLRPLNQGNELSSDMINATSAGPNSNTGLTSVNNATSNRILLNQTINSLTLLGSGAPILSSGLGTPAGVFGANGAPLTLTVSAGGVLALTNATIGIGAITSGGTTGDFHVVGAGTTLTLNGAIVSTTNGIVKADAGTLVFNARQYYTGVAGSNGTTVNGGTLRLNGGNNTIVVQPAGSIATPLSLFLNGGTLDLNGTSQIVERIQNTNPNAGTGGVVINSGGTTVTLTSATATGTTFAGSIGSGVIGSAGNAINFVKSGNSTLVLTNVNTYTGTTVVRGGVLQLQDSGTLATSAVTVNFGTLLLNEAGLNPLGVNPVRIPVAAGLTLNGSTLQQNSGGSLDASSTFNTLTLGSGANTITHSTLQNAGSSSLISIGSLVQQNNAGAGPATVNFSVAVVNNVAQGTLGVGGLNNSQILISNITPSTGGAVSATASLSNGMLPAWITVNGSDFAGYLSTSVNGSLGVGALGSANFPAYSGTPATAHSANNLSVTGTILPISGRTVNSLAVRNPAAGVDVVVPINLPTDTLSLSTGGLLLNSSNGGASVTVQGGRVSAGSVANTAASMYVTATGGNPLVINSQIVDNANQAFSANTDGISNVITVGSTSGLVVGQAVTGPGIPAGSTIQSISPNGTTFTINNQTTAASFKVTDIPKTNSSLLAGSNAVTVANTTNLVVGEYVSGPGVPAGTTVVALGTPAVPNTITLSNPATATIAQQTFFATVGNNSTTINLSPAQASTLTVGMTVSGTNVQANTVITSVNTSTGQVTVSNNTLGTSATQLLNFGATLNFARLGIDVAMPTQTPLVGGTPNVIGVTVNNTTGLVAGMTVTGAGIPAGTVIASFGTFTAPLNTVPNSTTVFLQAPAGQSFTTTGNIGLNIEFGTRIDVGNGTAGAVSLVKTGTGTLTLTPQPVINGSLNGTNQTPSNQITVPTTAGLLAGMTVTGSGIPAGATIASVNGTNTFLLSSNLTTSQGVQLSFGPGTSGVNVANSAFSNTYTGGTFVNQGTLNLAGFAGAIVIPGNLTINGTTSGTAVTMITNPQQIAAASNVTINGNGTLNLVGANTLASLTFNNSGGIGNPTVNLGTSNTLTLTNGITSVNDNLSFTPTIFGTSSTLALPNGTITTSGISPEGLIVTVPISPTGALIKQGAGSLILTPNVVVSGTTTAGANTFTVTNPNALSVGMAVTGTGLPAGEVVTAISGNTITVTTGTGVASGTNNLTFSGNTFATGVNLSAGSVILTQSSTPSTVGAVVTSGPVGTGAVNLADGTALLSDGTLRTLANAVNIAANATFGPLAGSGTALAGNGVILAGPVTLTGGGAHTITVPDLQNVTTISGQLSGGTGLVLTKNGTGTLVLSNAGNTFAGTTTVSVAGGVLRLGAATAVPLGLQLSVSPGAVYDLNGNANQVLASLTNPSPGTAGNGGMVTNSTGNQTLFVGGTSTLDNASFPGTTAVFDGLLTAPNTGTVAAPNYPGLALTKVGRGNQVLTGANLYSGATNVFAGQLTVNGSLANTNVTVQSGAVLGGTGSIGNAFGGGVTVTGSATPGSEGTVSLVNGSLGSFSLTTSGTGNGLTLGGSGAGTRSVVSFDIGNLGTDRLDITNSARLLVQLGGAIVNLTQLSGPALAAGNYNLITYSAATYTGSFTPGTVTSGASSATFASKSYVLVQTASSLVLQVGGVPLNFFWKGDVDASWNTNTAGNTNWATDLTGNTDTGAIPNATAVVTFKSTNALTLTTALGQDFTIDQLVFNNAAPTTTVTIGNGANVLTLNNNLTMNTGTGAVIINTAGLVVGSAQSWTNASVNNLTVTSPVTGTSPLTITSSSTGRVLLNGNNSGFSGGITIAGNGTNTALQLGSGTALGTGPLVVNVGALDLFGQNATVSSLSSTVATGIIKNTNLSTTSILTVNQIPTTTYSGAIQDSAPAKVGLTVDGGGTLQLVTTANTYSGGTIINNATLRLGNNGSQNAAGLGTGLVTINTGGLLNFSPGNAATTFNIPNTISLNGGQIQSSGGNQHLLANSIAPNTINVTASGGTITPSLTSGQDLFLDGVLAGSGPLTVGGGGSGRVILTNNGNTYSGTLTSTSAGNLQLAGPAAASTALQFANVSLATGANGLTFNGNATVGTPITSATFGSLSGGGGFALQNNAASPAAVALTVGGNNAGPFTYSGVISNSAAAILGTFTKTGSGTLILSGLNTYRGTTTVNGSGALRVSNNSTTASVTGLGNVSVLGTATLGGNGVIQGGDNITAGSVILANGTFLEPGLAAGSFGTLRFGVQVAAAVNTTLTLSTGSTYKFDIGTDVQDRVSVAGQASIALGANLVINSVSAPNLGLYNVLSTTAGLANANHFTESGVPSGYTVIYTANTVDLQKFSTIGTISTPVGLQVIKGASVPFGVTVQNSAPTGSADLVFTANSTPGTNTSGVTSPTTVGAQTTGTASGLSFNSAAVPIGPATIPNGTYTVTAAGASNSPQTGSVSVDVLDHAAFAPFTGGTLTLPNVRVGYVGPITSANSLTVGNGNAGDFRVDLKGAAAGAIGNLSVDSVSGIAAGTSKGITATLVTGQGQGAYSKNFTYALGDDSTLNGTNNGNLGTVTITVNGNVYNGQGVWGTNAGGSWGTFTNWTLPGGYPGLDGDASINDTATFGSMLSGTASLDGVSPLINALTFSNSSGTVAQGTGSGSITLRQNQNLVAPAINASGGTPTVSAPVIFQDSVNATITGAADRFTMSGPITGAGGITKAGAGTLVLSGANGYAGKTIVNAGTLTGTNSQSFGSVPSLAAVADQITVNNGATLAFTGNATLAPNQGITVGAGTATLDVAANQTLVVQGQLSGSGTLKKTGAGTFDARNFIQGPLILSAGTLAPTVGTPTSLFTGNIDFGGGTVGNRTLAIDVLGTNGEGNPGGHDIIFTSGPVTISAATNLSINLGSFHPTPGMDSFRFINDGSGNTPTYSSYFFVAGQDAGVSNAFDPTTNHVGKTFFVGSDAFQIDYAGGTGSDVVLLSVVPEPGSAVMLLGGVGLLALVSRRRRRSVPFGA